VAARASRTGLRGVRLGPKGRGRGRLLALLPLLLLLLLLLLPPFIGGCGDVIIQVVPEPTTSSTEPAGGEVFVPQEGDGTLGTAGMVGPATTQQASSLPTPLFQASLRNGDYGVGRAVPTMGPDRGASPNRLGIADSAQGVAFISTEADGRSNALISWEMGGDRQFRETGVIAFSFIVDRATFVPGELWGDNYGFTEFHNGQAAIDAGASLVENGPGTADDQVRVYWHSWHDDVWVDQEGTALSFGDWHRLAFTWGGLDDFALWVDGRLAHGADLPRSISLPWGSDSYGSAANVGLGGTHQRGYQAYSSVAGVTFADLKIWNTYVDGAAASLP
jgi:hypothetical protein